MTDTFVEEEVMKAIIDAFGWLRDEGVEPGGRPLNPRTVDQLIWAARAWLEIVEREGGR